MIIEIPPCATVIVICTLELWHTKPCFPSKLSTGTSTATPRLQEVCPALEACRRRMAIALAQLHAVSKLPANRWRDYQSGEQFRAHRFCCHVHLDARQFGDGLLAGRWDHSVHWRYLRSTTRSYGHFAHSHWRARGTWPHDIRQVVEEDRRSVAIAFL